MERQFEERLAVELEQVEDEVDEGAAPALQLGEARASREVDAAESEVGESGVDVQGQTKPREEVGVDEEIDRRDRPT